MAKKESKKTRESQYSEILSKQGVTLAECMVLGFRFEKESDVHIFHYRLMNAHVEYLLFDGTADGTAIVVIKKDKWNPETPDVIKIIAEQAGGTGYTPNMR